MQKAGDCGVEKYVFNEAVARRRLRSAILLTILFVAGTFVLQWVR